MYSTPSKLLREASQFSAGLAALFFTGALCCLYWSYSRGAFGNASVMQALNLAPASAIEAQFSVPYKGDHDLLIWYSRTQSMTQCDDLNAISGKAVLRIGDAVVTELALPVRHHRFEADGCAMILWAGPMEPEVRYSLLIETDRIPESLAKLQANLKIDPVADYSFLFLSLELLGTVLFLAASNCAIFAIRWRRAAKAICETRTEQTQEGGQV